jgi:hypothetical protein
VGSLAVLLQTDINTMRSLTPSRTVPRQRKHAHDSAVQY